MSIFSFLKKNKSKSKSIKFKQADGLNQIKSERSKRRRDTTFTKISFSPSKTSIKIQNGVKSKTNWIDYISTQVKLVQKNTNAEWPSKMISFIKKLKTGFSHGSKSEKESKF